MTEIASLTKDCEREDCRVVHHGSSTTLIGWSPTYDKRGNQVAGDPNTTTSNFTCNTCRKMWKVKSRDGAEDQIETFEVDWQLPITVKP